MTNPLEKLWVKNQLEEVKGIQAAIILQQNLLFTSLESLNKQSTLILTKILELEALVDHNVIPQLEKEIIMAQKMTSVIDSKVPDINVPPGNKPTNKKKGKE